MKNLGFIFLFLCVSAISGIAQESEKEAIIKLIEKEHLAMSKLDFETYASCFEHSERVLWGDGINYSWKGWEKMSHEVKSWMEGATPREPQIFYNYQIQIAKDKAWATFNKKWKNGDKPISKEQRILIKKDGEWKLVAMIFFPF